jgi:chitin deacetylase
MGCRSKARSGSGDGSDSVSNVLGNLAQFKYASDTFQNNIAMHTHSQPMMKTLSNEQVFAELGYTVQLVRDLTGWLLPWFWRPPYGD